MVLHEQIEEDKKSYGLLNIQIMNINCEEVTVLLFNTVDYFL